MPSFFAHLVTGLRPALPRPSRLDMAQGAMGGAVGLLICTLLVASLPNIAGFDMFLVAPLGATAVLAFAVPNAPLAQPYSAITGNIISAFAALLVLWCVPETLGWAIPGLAVGTALLAMMVTRSLHPPGGAVALLTVLSPDAALEAGVWYALFPVGLSTAALVAVAVLWNRAMGRVYPFRQPKPVVSATAPEHRLALTTPELEELLTRFHQSANLGVADLARLLAAAESEAAHHRFGATTCGDIMTRDVATVRPDARLRDLSRTLRDTRHKSLPVTDIRGRIHGLVTQSDVIAALTSQRGLGPVRPAAMIRRPTARSIMQPAGACVRADTPVGLVLNRMANSDVQVVMISDGDDRLVGIVSRSDIMALLMQDAQTRLNR